MTPHQENRLRLLTERGTVAFSREENLRKLAVECLELALVIEHHLEGKRWLEDIAYEGADVFVMTDRCTRAPFTLRELFPKCPTDEENLRGVVQTAIWAAEQLNEVLDGVTIRLSALWHEIGLALSWLRTYVGDQNWSSALDVKLAKAERYITDRELGRQPMSLLARPAGGLE